MQPATSQKTPWQKRSLQLALPPWGTREAPPTEFRLFAFGPNYGTGFGGGREAVYLDRARALAIVAEWKRRGITGAADYEHAAAGENPAGAPASAWFDLEVRDDGLWCTAVRWTERALEYFQRGEYRYFSPYFGIEQGADGKAWVVAVLNFALTNWPKTDAQRPLVARAWGMTMTSEEARAKADELVSKYKIDKTLAADLALELMALMAGETPAAPPEEMSAEAQAEKAQTAEQAAIGQAACALTGKKTIAEVRGVLAGWKANSEYVSTQGAAVVAETQKRISAKLAKAVEDKKITPHQRASYWAGKPEAELDAYLATAVPIHSAEIEPPAAQPGGAPPAPPAPADPKSAINAEMRAHCAKRGYDEKGLETFAATWVKRYGARPFVAA